MTISDWTVSVDRPLFRALSFYYFKILFPAEVKISFILPSSTFNAAFQLSFFHTYVHARKFLNSSE